MTTVDNITTYSLRKYPLSRLFWTLAHRLGAWPPQVDELHGEVAGITFQAWLALLGPGAWGWEAGHRHGHHGHGLGHRHHYHSHDCDDDDDMVGNSNDDKVDDDDLELCDLKLLTGLFHYKTS